MFFFILGLGPHPHPLIPLLIENIDTGSLSPTFAWWSTYHCNALFKLILTLRMWDSLHWG